MKEVKRNFQFFVRKFNTQLLDYVGFEYLVDQDQATALPQPLDWDVASLVKNSHKHMVIFS